MNHRAVLCVLAIASALCVRAEEKQDGLLTLAPRDFGSTGEAMQYGLGRGVVNLFTCWLEIPRNLSVEFTGRPLVAVVTGPLMGATMTSMRAIFGTVDLLTAGYTGYYDYAAGVSDYPWDAPWVSETTDYD